MITADHFLALIFLIMAMVGAAGTLSAWRQYQTRREMLKRSAEGRRGEEGAAKLLRKQGYRILDDQVSRQASVLVDQVPHPYQVRADYLVESVGGTQRGNRYVVEVKTGAEAPNPVSRATRRQLLEYHHLFDVDGLLLADMQAHELHHIGFESHAEDSDQQPDRLHTSTIRTAIALAVGFVFGLLAAPWLPFLR